MALAALGGCSSGGTTTGASGDEKAAQLAGGGSDPSVSPAPPGKYQTLPAPCTAVGAELLRQLVPAVPDVAGSEALTFDTDRRVGCSWRGTTTAGTSDTLKIDLERVVSYDPAVSDEVQAETDYNQKANSASIPPLSSASPSAPGNGTTSTTGTGTAGSPDLSPRRLTDVGNAAFINDVLKAHTSPPRRDVTLVFRTANVLVTVSYAESSPRGGPPPDSADLQKGAQQVADQLERKVKS